MFSNICTFFCFLFASFQHTLSLSVHAHFSLSFYLCFLFSFSLTSFRLAGQGIAPNVMAPLPKRAALEKANGASAMFNTSMLQYQQALASMQFQQQAAFLPSVPMMHGGNPATVSAATTSATSVPFATASTNQVCTFTALVSLSLSLTLSLSITSVFQCTWTMWGACILQQGVGWVKGGTPSCWPTQESNMCTHIIL